MKAPPTLAKQELREKISQLPQRLLRTSTGAAHRDYSILEIFQLHILFLPTVREGD